MDSPELLTALVVVILQLVNMIQSERTRRDVRRSLRPPRMPRHYAFPESLDPEPHPRRRRTDTPRERPTPDRNHRDDE